MSHEAAKSRGRSISIVGRLCLPLLLVPCTLLGAAAPVVDRFEATPATLAPGELSDLVVEAHDPDCPATCTSGCGLRIRADLVQWSATGGSFESIDNGASSSPYTATARWRAPATEGAYTITVTLPDSGSFVCGGRQTTTAELSLQVTTVVDQPPVIDSLTANPLLILPGETSSLVCLASDPEGGSLTWSWTADPGTVTPGSGGSAVFHSDQPGIATITCTVTDSSGLVATETLGLSVRSAVTEKALRESLLTPLSVDVASTGDVFVADAATRGITVIHLVSGETVYHLHQPGITEVAVDWKDDLLVGGAFGSRVIDRRGRVLLPLLPGESLGEVSAVAVDRARRRYAVLHRNPGRVVVYDDAGSVIGRFGSNGDAPEQLRTPEGLAVTPNGELLVADTGHGRIKAFDVDGNLLRAFGDLGGGAGEFVRLHDVAVTASGLVYASDAFQSWVQVFAPDGELLEVLGTFGQGLGELKTPAGLAAADAFDRLLVASVNNSSVQVFLLDRARETSFPEPLAALSSTSLSFPDQPVGTTGAIRTVRLSNGGDAPLGLRRVTVVGDFSQDNSCKLFLDPGESCVFQVRFTPAAPGLRDGRLELDTSAAAVNVSLSGVGFVPASLTLDPPRVAFGDQTIGTVSDPVAVTLSNPGSVPLTLSSIGVQGEFRSSSGCVGPLASGASCTIQIRFAPKTASDAILGSLDIVAANGVQGTVSLFGAGVGRLLDPIPGIVSLGPVPPGQLSELQTVTLANSGNLHVSIDTPALEGDGAGQFLISADRCGGSLLPPGDACTFDVAFLPSSEGRFSARVAIPGDAFNSPVVELTGIAGGATILEIPTLRPWVLVLLALMLGALGVAALHGRI